MVNLLDGTGFQAARGAVAQAALTGAAMVDGGVFPKGADFVDDRNLEFAGDFDGGQDIDFSLMLEGLKGDISFVGSGSMTVRKEAYSNLQFLIILDPKQLKGWKTEVRFLHRECSCRNDPWRSERRW